MSDIYLASYPGRGGGGGESGLVSNVCACAEITKKTGNRILSVLWYCICSPLTSKWCEPFVDDLVYGLIY